MCNFVPMKPLRYIYACLISMALAACNAGNTDVCRIHGTMMDPSHDGMTVYLVPLENPDSIGVDSTVIENAHFEFETQKHILAAVRMAFFNRAHAQQILVVTEPGDIQVTMGDVSSSAGTPQNDSLQAWKEATEFYQSQRLAARNEPQAVLDSLEQNYMYYTWKMTEGLGDCLLSQFFHTHILNHEEPR